MDAALEEIVRHSGRLDILCCLQNEEPQAIVQLSAKTGMSPEAVGHHIELLTLFGLVEEREGSDKEILYLTTVSRHPDWIQAAIKDHCSR